MRSVQRDLMPGFEHPGLHLIIEGAQSSKIRKLLPKTLVVRDVELSTLKNRGPFMLADYIQRTKHMGESVVVFLQLDPFAEQKMAETREPPPHTTPARTLRDLIPTIIQHAAESICYVTDNMVLAVKHTRLPADAYLFEDDGEKEKEGR